jgi:hypothetical protein
MRIRNVFIVMIGALLLTIFPVADSTSELQAQTFTSKYTIKVNGETVDANVYLNDGRSYIPIRKLTDALDYSIEYSKLNELDIYHNYDIYGASQRVSIWGNERWGYSIVKRVAEQDHPDDEYIYDPVLACPNESDNCRVIKDLYEGPVILNNTMYVPVRYLAEALDLQLRVSGNVIYLSN